LELKTFALITGEAVRLGPADANPLVILKLKRYDIFVPMLAEQ